MHIYYNEYTIASNDLHVTSGRDIRKMFAFLPVKILYNTPRQKQMHQHDCH